MSATLEPPSGLLCIVIPSSRFGGRWSISVRGETIRRGLSLRSAKPLIEGMAEVATVCDRTPGLGEAGGELRHLIAAMERVVGHG